MYKTINADGENNEFLDNDRTIRQLLPPALTALVCFAHTFTGICHEKNCQNRPTFYVYLSSTFEKQIFYFLQSNFFGEIFLLLFE